MTDFFNYDNIFLMFILITPVIIAFLSKLKSIEIIESIKIPGTLLILLGDLIALIIETIISTILKSYINGYLKELICYIIMAMPLFISPIKVLAEFFEETKIYKSISTRHDGAYIILYAFGCPLCKAVVCSQYGEWLEYGMYGNIKDIDRIDFFLIFLNVILCIITDIRMKKIQ